MNTKIPVKIICKTCNKEFYVCPSIAKQGKKYCSDKCYRPMRFIHNPNMKIKISKTLMGRFVGEKNPNFVPRISCICEICKKEFFVQPSISKTRRFCSRKCTDKWRSKVMKGENNHNYKKIKDMNPGCRKEIRKKILKRDNYQCCNCNSKNNLQIHHINCNWKSNFPNNLITLCKECHAGFHELIFNQIHIASLILKHPI